MKALPNDKWRAACIARFEVRSNSDAIRLGGFGNPEGTTTNSNLARIAYGIFHDERMLAALHEEGLKRLKSGAPDAIAAVYEILGDRDHKDRLAAARVALSYAHPQESLNRLVVEHKVDFTKQALEELAQFRKLGVERAKLEQIYGRDGLWHLEQQLDGKTGVKMIDVTPASAP
jgi:hypothetical protein